MNPQVDRLAAGQLFGSAGGSMYKWSLGCDEESDTCDVTSVEVLEGALNGEPDLSLLATDLKQHGCR